MLGHRSLYFLKTVSIVTSKKIQRYNWLTTARWFAVIDVMYFCVWLFVNVLFFRAIKIYLLHKKITSMIRGRDKNNHEIEMKLGASWFIWYSFKTIWWMSMSISLYGVVCIWWCTQSLNRSQIFIMANVFDECSFSHIFHQGYIVMYM